MIFLDKHMDSILNVLIRIVGLFFRKKPIILTICAYNDSKILLHSVCNESFVIQSIEPSKKISKFPKDYIVNSKDQFYIYSASSFSKNNYKKLKIRIKLLNGAKYTYFMKWDNKTPCIK